RRTDKSRDREGLGNLLHHRGCDATPDSPGTSKETEGILMNNQDFDRLVDSIRDDAPDAETARAAAERVREQLGAAGGPDGGCIQFRADFDAFRAKKLTEGRRMLLEDHLHSCVACRREYTGATQAPVVVIKRSRPATRRLGWAAAAAVLIGALAIGGYAMSPQI